MKKLTLICTTLIIIGILYTGKNSANAQGLAHKFSFGLNVGVGMPGGDFKKADSSALPLVNDPKTGDTTKYNGFAKTGFHFDVTATYMFSSNVGAMISLGGTMNSYDIAAFNTVAAAQFGNGGGGALPPVFTTSGNYFVGEYLIGPYVAIPLGSDKLKLEFKGLVGLMDASYPTLSYSFSGGGFSATGSYAVKGGSGFGYKIGAGLKYMVADVIGLHLDLGYAGSSVTYSSYTTTSSETGLPSTSYTDPVSKTMSLSLFQITVGASIDL